LAQQSDSQVEIKTAGRYYVRVVGLVPGTGDELTGKPVSFMVTKAVELKPPQLIEPAPGTSLAFEQVRSQGVNFTWSDADGAERYHLSVTRGGKPLFKRTVTDSTYRAKLKPGSYQWTVQTAGE